MGVESFNPVTNINIFLFVIASLLVLATYTWQFNKIPGAKVQVYGQLCKAFWLLSMLLLSTSNTLSDKLFWVIIVQATSVLSPYLWFSFIIQISEQDKFIPSKFLYTILGITIFFISVILSTPWHGLHYGKIILEGNTLVCNLGSLFRYYGLWAYFLCFLAVSFSIRWIIITKGLRRRQALWFTISGLLSLLSVLFGAIFQIKSIDSMPFGFLLAAIFIAWGFYRWKVYNLITLAQEAAVDNMVDGLIVIDENNYISAMNLAAKKFLDSSQIKIGSKFDDIIDIFPNLNILKYHTTPSTIETEINISGEIFFHQWNIILLQAKNYTLGKAFLIKNITLEKQEQARLVEHEKAIAIVEERQSLAREVHDDLCQTLGYINFQSQAVINSVKDGKIDSTISNLYKLMDVTKHAYDDAREYIRGVQYMKLQNENLFSALQQYIKWLRQEYNLNITLKLPPSSSENYLNSLIDLHLFRIIQEAISNIRKHSQANNCVIKILIENNHVVIIISDDGIGFNTNKEYSGFGLTTMSERTKKIGGTFDLSSSLGSGTTITIKIPIN